MNESIIKATEASLSHMEDVIQFPYSATCFFRNFVCKMATISSIMNVIKFQTCLGIVFDCFDQSNNFPRDMFLGNFVYKKVTIMNNVFLIINGFKFQTCLGIVFDCE